MVGQSIFFQRQTEVVLNRRDWLRGITGACIAVSLRSLIGASTSEPAEFETWLRQGRAYFLGDHKALRKLGAAYLQMVPEEGGLHRLSGLVVDAELVPVELRLLKKISRDWDDHNIVTVQGWVMARTEARLCAALHLVDGGQA